MARLFDAYVMVDWSASSKPATGPDSVWVGVMKRDVRLRLAFSAANPATRAEAAALLDKQLKEFARRRERVLLGFDFSLGFPRGSAAALKLDPAKAGPPWRAMLSFVAGEIRDKPDNTNNRFQVGAKMNRLMTGEAFPFWGCPARDEQSTLKAKRLREHREGDLPEWRYADQAMKGLHSVWKLYYQGSVGGQALTGLPRVKRLKDEFGERLKIWPFETGWAPLAPEALEGVDVVVAEIWPSMFPLKPAAGEVRDAAQVRAAAEHFAQLDEAGRLSAAFGPKPGAPPAEIVVEEEGWILGA